MNLICLHLTFELCFKALVNGKPYRDALWCNPTCAGYFQGRLYSSSDNPPLVSFVVQKRLNLYRLKRRSCRTISRDSDETTEELSPADHRDFLHHSLFSFLFKLLVGLLHRLRSRQGSLDTFEGFLDFDLRR